ncbi:MAG TPA: hypothetical protein VGO59_21210 [Verrucomicrobiae bacterium]|jgi:hypothetical protein
MSAAAIDLPPPDRVRMIRRSMRCFAFGLVGAIPCFGLGMGWLAFKLYRDIAAETGESIKLYPLFLTSISGLVLGAVCFKVHWPNTALAEAVLMAGLQFLFLRRQHLKNAPAEWNPGRHLMYVGLGLANAGLILSGILVMAAVYAVNHY